MILMRTMILCTVVLAFFASCAPREHSEFPITDRPIKIVATTNIVADLARTIGQSETIVESLMGPGVDPHLYKASARDVSRMGNADLVVYNGLHLEGKMGDVFVAMNRQGTPTIAIAEVSIPDSLLISSELFQGNYDPHIWFDAHLWAMAAEKLADALGQLDSTRADYFFANASNYRMELMELDRYVRERISGIPSQKRILITSHDAFGYFGQAYDIEVYGLQGLSTVLEVGAKDVQDLADLVVQRRIPAMFVESSVSTKGIEAVQEAVQARGFEVRIGGTLYGDALGSESTEATNYQAMVRYNIETIVKALSDG